MQKRRGHDGGRPLTTSDTNQHDDTCGDIRVPSSFSSPPLSTYLLPQNDKKRIRRKKGISSRGSRDFNRIIYGCAIVSTLIIGGFFLHSRNNLDGPNSGEALKGRPFSQRKAQEDSKPLSKFESLQYPLSQAKMVGLYFAASWCPMSTPVTEMLDEYFGDILLPPTPPERLSSRHDPIPLEDVLRDGDESTPLSIVFVSSDTVEEKFQQYIRRNWIAVPFHSPERTSLKKHFLVCSKPEVERLGIHRKFEIPTLIILDSGTHAILSHTGAEDVAEYGEKVIDYWMDIRNLARGLEHMYVPEEEGEDGHQSW
jgi:hypothetical protein